VQTLTIPKVDTTSRKLEFSPDGTLLVNAISGAGTQVWRVSDWQLVKEFAEQGYFSFTAAGQIVLEVADGKLQFMDTGNWSIARTLEGIKGYNLVFSPDNKLIATVLEGRTGPERTVAVYRVEDGKLLYQLKTYASHLVFSPDSRYLLTDSSKSWYLASGTDNENRLQIWNMANGQLAKEFGNYTFTIDKLAYSPSGSIAIQSFRYLTLWKPDLS
jgi:WD40 repeat protein